MNPQRARRAPAGAASAVERSPARDRAHTTLLILPWALLVVLWLRALDATGSRGLGVAVAVVGLCLVLTVALTAAWIAHNVAIYRAKGPRRGLPAVELAYERDWTGRRVSGDWDRIRSAAVVFVAGTDRHKTFVPASGRADARAGAVRAHAGPPGRAPART